MVNMGKGFQNKFRNWWEVLRGWWNGWPGSSDMAMCAMGEECSMPPC